MTLHHPLRRLTPASSSRRASSIVTVLAALALGAAAAPGAASAQTEPGSSPATWAAITDTTPALTSMSAAPMGSGAGAYLRTTYDALANASIVGLTSTETITSPTFTWTQAGSQAHPQAVTLSLNSRAALGQLVGINGGVTVDTGLQAINPSNGHPIGTPVPLDSEQLTQSSDQFDTITQTVSPSLLTSGGEYEIVVTEQVAPLVQVVGGATIDLGALALDVTPATPPPPVISAGSAAVTDVTSTDAQADATVDPGSTDTTVTVDYGTTTAYGSQVSETVPANAGATNVALPISGLSPSTSYHAEIVATNSAGGTTSSPDLTFSTSAQPPSATAPTISAPQVDGTPGERAATIGATIDTGGQGGSYYVEYGTSTGYGSSTGVQTLGSGTTGGVPVTVDMSGLTPGSTYHARVVAMTAGGTTDGPDLTVSTAAPTPPTTTAPQIATANSTGSAATVSTTVDPGADDTQVSVSDGSSPSALSSTTPTQTVSAGSGATGLQFPVTGLTPGTTYYFQVDATNADGQTASSVVSYTPTATTSPVLGSTSVLDVQQRAATLQSSIDTGGAPATDDIAYGTSPSALSSTTPSQTLATESGAQALGATLAGLAPDTTYYARFVVTFANGSSQGQIIEFRTAPLSPPTIDATSFTDRGQTGATLQATVDPGDLDTSVYALYGPTTGYGSRTQTVTIPADSGPTTVTIVLSGLSSDTAYHVQLVTANADDTVHSADLPLQTAAATTATTPAVPGAPVSPTRTTTTTTMSPPAGTGTRGSATCVAAYLTAPTRTLQLLRLSAGAEVTAAHALRITFPRGTRGTPSYRIAGGRVTRPGRRGFSLRLGQLRAGTTTRLNVALPRSGRTPARRLSLAIASLPCGARLGAQRVGAGRVAVTVRSALGTRRVALSLPRGWSSPSAIAPLTNLRARTLRIVAHGRTLRVLGGGRLRISRHGGTLVVTGLPATATGVVLTFNGHRGVSGRWVARVSGGRATRTAQLTVGASRA